MADTVARSTTPLHARVAPRARHAHAAVPRRRCASSRRASCAARTTGRASPSSGCWSTSASSRATRPTCCRTSPTRWSRCCRRSRTTPVRSAGAAASSPGCATGRGSGHIAEHVALEFQNLAGTDVRHGKTRAPGPVGQYNCIYEYREEAVGLEAGRMAVALVNHLVAPDDPDVLLRLRARDGAPHPARRAAGVRSVDAGAHRRGGQPRHPVHPARPPLAGPVRARRPPAADPGDDDLADLGHRRRRGVRQEPDQPAARFGRPAGPARRRRRQRRRRRSPRPSGSASRAWSSRSTATTAGASTSTCAPRRRSAPPSTARSPRAARATSWSSRTSPATTIAAWSSAARSRPSPSASRPSVTGDGEHTVRQLVDIANSDPRRGHRPREGPDPDQGRRGGRGAGPRPGLRDGRRPARRDLGQARADRQHVDRRDVDRPDDRGAPRQRRDRRDRGADRRARRRRHRLHLPRHRDARARDRRRDRRGQRRARLPDAHPPDRGRAAVRRPAGHRFALPGGVRRRASRSSR